ncbi:MAG TPA: hypothetical protein VKB92_05655 [Myxococcales bacterium]|nr:hypothetical protein [Myxococcales bacterium]
MRSRFFLAAGSAPAGDLVRVLDGALEDGVLRRASLAIARLGTERLRQSYFTTFWLPRGDPPANAVEEAVLELWRVAAPGPRCAGAEWWIGRSYTTEVPVGFHFDQDVRARRGLRHPRLSTVFFFNRVRGGQLAVTDQRAGPGGRPRPAAARELQIVVPRRNRYAMFDGGLFHGVLDARGLVPGRKLPSRQGRLRVTLVVNFWELRPTGVPRWRDARAYRALAGKQVPR